MAEIGKEYKIFNVKEPPQDIDGRPAYSAARGNGITSDTTAIQQAIDSLSAHRNRRPRFAADAADDAKHKMGGIVYFPPGRYVITSTRGPAIAVANSMATETDAPITYPNYVSNRKHGGSLYVPDDVTLQFAPGAILILSAPQISGLHTQDGAIVEIEGAIDAGVHQIFDVRWHPTRGMGAMETEDRTRPGALILSSQRVTEVYPEWWGAIATGGVRGLNDAWRPIQDALNAAFRDRTLIEVRDASSNLGTGVNASYPPIPVRLSATYDVERPLILEGAPGEQQEQWAGFRLFGTQAVGTANQGKPALQGAFGDGALQFAQAQGIPLAVLFIKKAFGFSVENVGFSAGVWARDAGVTRTSPSNNVRTAVWVEAGVRDPASSEPRDLFKTTGATQLGRFHRCSFVSSLENDQLRELVYLGGGVGDPPRGRYGDVMADDDRDRGVLYSDDLLGLSFDQCMFDLPGTIVSAPPDADGAIEARFEGRRNARGVVVNAGNALPVQFTTCFFNGFASKLVSAVSGTLNLTGTSFHNQNPAGWDIFVERPGKVGRLTDPAGLTATQCESQSWRFLGSYNDPNFPFAIWNTVVVGCHHGNVNIGYLDTTDHLGRVARGDRRDEPPSIEWHEGGSLQLLGCRFDGDVLIGPNAKAVVDIGTCFSPHRGGPASNLVPGGGFKGNLAVLRGSTGLVAWRGSTGHDTRLGDPCIRIGEGLMATTPSLKQPNYSWQEGDVWLRAPSPRDPAETESTYTTLGRALHREWHDRVYRFSGDYPRRGGSPWREPSYSLSPDGFSVVSSFQGWEDIFGSENYSGPWVAYWDEPRQEFFIDGVIAPVPGAIYEVLWSIRPASGDLHRDHLHAVGRNTVTVESTNLVPTGAMSRYTLFTWPNVRVDPESRVTDGTVWDLDHRVTMEAHFAPLRGHIEATAVPAAELASADGAVSSDSIRTLRLVFSKVLRAPWRNAQGSNQLERLYKVVVRRLL